MSLIYNNPLAAVIQMVSGFFIEDNLIIAAQQLKLAKDKGAVLAVLPENFAVFDSKKLISMGQQEASSEGVIRQWLAVQAKQLSMWIVAGTIPCAGGVTNPQRVRSSCFVYDDQGQQVARYDKIHLFDAQVNDLHKAYRESDKFEAGTEIVVLDSPIGRLGLSVCYDLRFAELHQTLVDQGAQVICNCAAFTKTTGKAHWHSLLRARAIDTQCYMLASGQGGAHTPLRKTFGHSMIIDPWGKVIQELGEGAGIAIATIDLALVQRTREKMPFAEHRRLL